MIVKYLIGTNPQTAQFVIINWSILAPDQPLVCVHFMVSVSLSFSLFVFLQPGSLKLSVRTGSAVPMSSVARGAMVGNPAATVGPFLPQSTDQQALLVSNL